MLHLIYDPLVWVLTIGRAARLRQATLAAANVGPGDDVLDVGCATGPLTIAARRSVGGDGRVTGLDASPSMLTRARARAGLDVEFVHGKAEHLPFPEATFDVVLLSLVLHELPAPATAIAEAHRVLRDGGRIVVADFGRSTGFAGKARAHLLLHGGVAATAPDPITQLSEGGFTKVQTAPCPVPALAITQGIRLNH